MAAQSHSVKLIHKLENKMAARSRNVKKACSTLCGSHFRRVPFAQIFHLKSELEGQSLGIITHAATPEIKEIIAGSLAAQAGINAKAKTTLGYFRGISSVLYFLRIFVSWGKRCKGYSLR